MMTKFKRILGFFACVCLCLCFFACGDNTSLSIVGKNRISIEAGSSYTIKVKGLSSTAVATWESSDETVASVSNGTVTGLKEGEAIITASYEGDSASVTVVVRKRTVNITVDGKLVTLDYGEKLTKPADPLKPADAQYTYNFKGWYSGGVPYDFDEPVTKTLLIEAVYEKVLNKYEVKVGSAAAVQYDYGALVESPVNPTKASTAQYDYIFKGWYNGTQKWNFAADTVKENLTLTAEFEEVLRQFKVTFDGKNAVYLKYGDKIQQPADPVMASDAQYTYEFLGWYNGTQKWNFATDTVTAKTELTAKFDAVLNQYTVKIGENVQTLAYGTKIAKPANPVKAPDAQYTYTFKGWMTQSGEAWDFDKDVVIGDTTLIADYDRVLNKYTVTVDGTEAEYAYGAKVVRPATPTKEPDGENTYYFDKYVISGTETEWNFNKDVVKGDLSLTAVFKKQTNKYLISFGGITFAEYNYGDKIERPDDPVRESDDSNDYYFDHWEYEENGAKKTWDFETDTVTESKPGTLTPVFTAQARAYVVSFVSDGVEVAKSARTRVGETVAAPQAIPEKAPSATLSYTFEGWYNGKTEWNFETDTVNGPLTLTARYSVSPRQYSVIFKNGETETEENYIYGAPVRKPADPASYTEGSYKYEFAGWVNAKGEQWNFTTGIVTEDMVLSAKFNPAPIRYEVRYEDEYGNFIYLFNVEEGGTVPQILSASKEANVRYSYNFRFWTADGETAFDFANAEIKSDIVLTPVFEEVVRQYNVTLKNYDGTVFDTMKFEYGAEFEYPVTAELPMKDIEGDENSYVFEFWSAAADGTEFTGDITANITLYAIYRIDNNEYTVVYYDYKGDVIDGATQDAIRYNKLLNLPDAERENTKEIRYTFTGWSWEKPDGTTVIYPAGQAIRCAGNMELHPVYDEETIYYYVSVNLTDADGNYVLTAEDGTPLTEADLKLTYNKVFRFKADVNSESVGNIVIKRGSTTLTPDENGVYSFNVRDELVRVTVSGLTLRRYTITDNVTLAKQSDSEWARLISSENDIIVKLTCGDETRYIENAVKGGVMTLNGLVAGNYTVEYVAKDGENNYRLISDEKYTNELNAEWAVANGQDETMTWTLGGTLAGYAPVSLDGDYKWINGVIRPETYKAGQNGHFSLTELAPGAADFIVTATYNQPEAHTEPEGPSAGFQYITADGSLIEINFLNEGKMRLLDPVGGWDGRIETHNMLCSAGAILNMYGDCYTRVTVTHVKKGNYLYMFGSFSRPGGNVVAVKDKLMAVIDVSTGTLYTASKVNGSSEGRVTNPLVETGEYQIFQNDEWKKLADITKVTAYYGITKRAPIEVYGVNYSYNKSDIDLYADTACTKVVISTDDHVNVRVNNPTGKSNLFNVWQDGSLKFVPDNGYIIDTVTVNGEVYAASVNKDGHFTLNFNKDFESKGTVSVAVTTVPGTYEGWTVVNGTVTSDGVAKAGAVVTFERNGKLHTVTADANGRYEIMLPAGTYTLEACEKYDAINGFDYPVLQTAWPYKALYTVSGASAAKNIELETMIGGYNIGAVAAGDQAGITFEGTSNDDFAVNARVYKNTTYMLNRKLADGQMIKFSLKFNEECGLDEKTGTNKAGWHDIYLKFTVGGKNLGLTSGGDMWNGTRVNPTPFSSYAWNMQNGIYGNVYDFAYARQGNRVYLLVKYAADADYVALSYADVTDAKAAVKLELTGREGPVFDFTYGSFGFIGDKAEVDACIKAAVDNKSTAKTRNIGSAAADGNYDVFINGNYGAAITDKIYDKTQGTAVLTANVKAKMQGFAFIGFMMRDPVTGNFVNFGINEFTKAWRTSVANGNGYGYRSGWALENVEWNAASFNIGDGNNLRETQFTLKAVVTGDTWTVYVNGVMLGSIDLRAYWENNYIGGGETKPASSGNAKHGWSETKNLYPTADKVQLGVYAFVDTVKECLFSDVSLEISDNKAMMKGLYVDNIESVKNPEDIVYTVYKDYGSVMNTPVASSTVGIKDGEAMLFTMQYNEGEGARKTHGDRFSGTRSWGDMYINLGIDGKAYRISSGGCTCGSWDSAKYPSATPKNNVFDFAMDRDMWFYGGDIANVAKYDFAIVKKDGKVDLYAKYHGATEWAIMYTADNNNPLTYIDCLQMTSAGGFYINFSLTGMKIAAADEVLSHVWDFAKAGGYYSSASKTINEDGTAGYTVHLGLSGTKQWTQSMYRTTEVYNAKDNTVVISGDYSLWTPDADWSMAGWNFADATDAKKKMAIGFRSVGAKNTFIISYNHDAIDNYGKRYTNIAAADPDNGLLVCNPNAIAPFKGRMSRFSAKWVINGYRFQLYTGVYGEEPDTLMLDIDVKTYMTKYKPSEGNDNMVWGGSDELSADKCVPDMSAFRLGFAMSNDVRPKDNYDLPASKGMFYCEGVTAKTVFTGADTALTGPAYKLITDEEGNRIMSDYWYAEAEFSGSVNGSGWAGIITDMTGSSELDTSDAAVKAYFYGTGYGYGQVYIHTPGDPWFNGRASGSFATAADKVKIGTARLGNKVLVYIDDILRGSYYVSDKPSNIGFYAGTGTLNDVTVKNFTYTLDKAQVDSLVAAKNVAVSKTIDGKTYSLTMAEMGGFFGNATGGNFKSFGANYTVTGRDSADMTDICFSYAGGATGNIYYMEAEFTNKTGWNGIICNTFDVPHASNSVYYGVGFGYGDEKSTQLYMHTTSNWNGQGDPLGRFPIDGNPTVRLGIARIDETYYIFLDGKFATVVSRPAISTQNTSAKLPKDNESGFGVFNESGPNKVGAFKNAAYTTDESVVRAIVDGTRIMGGLTAFDYRESYVVSGKMDISDPGAGNRYIGFNVEGGNNRFLLWDKEGNGTFEFAYSMEGSHVHNGNLPASQYITVENGKTTTIDWKVIHDGTNAYFLIDGEVKLVYTNAVKSNKFQVEIVNVMARVYDIKAFTSASAEEYNAELEAIAGVRTATATSMRTMVRMTMDDGLEISHNATTGATYHENINPVVYGTMDNYVYETNLVIEECGANAHFGIELSSDGSRFLFWRTGTDVSDTLKATWAYDGGWNASSKYQLPLTGTYKMKLAVVNGNAYWFVNGTLMCGIKAAGQLDLRIESMKAHTENSTVISKALDEKAFNAAIAGLELPSFDAPTRF